MRNKFPLVTTWLVTASMSLAACAQGVTKTVKATEPDQPTEIIPTAAIPTDTQESIQPTSTEAEIKKPIQDPDPGTLTYAAIHNIETLDPAWNYESSGARVIRNVYDTLVTYAGADPNEIVPMLAADWVITDDGMKYVFTIREGVKFHQGQDLTAEDVAYSFQRGLLQGHTYGPQWLFTEAFFGTGIYDIAELVDPEVVDDPEALQAVDPAKLLEVCERVTKAIAADEATGSVTFSLSQPWAPLETTLAGTWGSIIDKDWAIEHGAWDGDCATWQDYYGRTSENTPLRDVANGTGPYIFDHWTPGEEVVLVANEDYWLAEPLWEGGPSGAPRIKRVVIRFAGLWADRFEMLQSGEADSGGGIPSDQVEHLVGEVCTFIDWGEYDCQLSENPDQPLRLYKGTYGTSRADLFFVFEINEEGGNPYLGSGKLDGDGIPPDFFADIHVRKAFNYCFDWDANIGDREAVQNYGPFNVGLIGYDENAPHYSHDPEMCQAEIEQAWDGALAQNGFRMQMVSCNACTGSQDITKILKTNFAAIDPRYQIETISMPWSNFLAEGRASRLPIVVTNWIEDIHDPHNWVMPVLITGLAGNLPQELIDEFQPLVDAGVVEQDRERRAAIYREIQWLDYEHAPAIRMVVRSSSVYVQRWVSDLVINPLFDDVFYLWAKD